MASARKVGLLALIYREVYNARHSGPSGLLDDLETCPGELSLVGMMGSQALTDLDWFIVRAMEQPDTLPSLACDLGNVDAIRAEALLHAWPPGEAVPDEAWVAPYRARWKNVEAVMDGFRALGLTATYDDVELVAVEAYRAGG